MDETSALFGPYGELGGVNLPGVAFVGAGDGGGVAFVLILGVEQPLAVLLVLHAEGFEFFVEGFCTPSELFGDLGGGVGACGTENGLAVFHIGGLLLDYLLLQLVLLLQEFFLGFGLL